MAPLFYQKYWNIMGGDVKSVVLHALQMGMFLHSLNHTHIVVIPKNKNPEMVIDFHPISLCNMLNKIVFIVLANVLKLILLKIISCTQRVFGTR